MFVYIYWHKFLDFLRLFYIYNLFIYHFFVVNSGYKIFNIVKVNDQKEVIIKKEKFHQAQCALQHSHVQFNTVLPSEGSVKIYKIWTIQNHIKKERVINGSNIRVCDNEICKEYIYEKCIVETLLSQSFESLEVRMLGII